MATEEQSFTGTWSVVGSTSTPFTPRGNHGEVFYNTSSVAAPAATVVGHFLTKNEPVVINPDPGEWAWVRVAKKLNRARGVKG